MKFKYQALLVLAVILTVTLTACGGNNQPTNDISGSNSGASSDLDMYDPLAVSGDIVVAGSSTVFPLASRMAERFEDEGFSGSINIASVGSSAGFERFCVAGETDISNASRPIKESEVDDCSAIGREPVELVIGIDALAVVVSAENDFLTEVTTDELFLIFGEAESWSDVRSEWPDEPIQRYIPGTDSGTFDYFVEAIFDKDETGILTPNPQMSEDDNVLVQGIQSSPYAVGFFGYAYYAENADTLNVLNINGVEPTEENVVSFEYPLSRPIFMYTDPAIVQEKIQVAAYLKFVLTYVNEEILSVGYFPLSAEDLQTSMDALNAALGQ